MEFLGALLDAWDFAEAASKDTEDKTRKRCLKKHPTWRFLEVYEMPRRLQRDTEDKTRNRVSEKHPT